LSAARGVSFGAVTEALSFGHGVALVLELGKLPAPLLAGCDVVRVLVEIVHVRAHDLDRPHAGTADPICKKVSGQKAEDNEDPVADRSGGDAVHAVRRYQAGIRFASNRTNLGNVRKNP
jgi:hypothetical protein